MLEAKDKHHHAASADAQHKKSRVSDLGRGSDSKSMLQSPSSGASSEVADVKEQHLANTVQTAVIIGSSTGSSSEVDKQHTGALVETCGAHANLTSGSETLVGPKTDPCRTDGSGQQHTGAESTTRKKSRAQRRNEKKKLLKSRLSATQEEVSIAAKRPMSDGSTPSSHQQEVAKKSREESLPVSISVAVNLIKVAIVRENFPFQKLSEDEASAIRVAIVEMIDAIPHDGFLPKFENNIHAKGALVIYCADPQSADWVRSNFSGKKEVLAGEALKVIEANDLLKPVKMAFETKDVITRQPEVFLKRIKRNNPVLCTEDWRVLQTSVKPQSISWIIEMDPIHVEALRMLDFRAFTALDRGFFKIFHDPNM